MARLFGTDGVRGLANKDITPHLALDLSIAAARVLGEVSEFAGHGRMAIVGRRGSAFSKCETEQREDVGVVTGGPPES